MADHRIKINDNLYSQIAEYAKLNSIPMGKLCEKLLETGFNMEKWGTIPFGTIANAEVKEVPEQSKPNYLETQTDKIFVGEPIPTKDIKQVSEQVCIISPGTDNCEEEKEENNNNSDIKPRKRRL